VLPGFHGGYPAFIHRGYAVPSRRKQLDDQVNGSDDITFNNDAAAVAVVPCWSCAANVDGRVPFCHGCGVIQPPAIADEFRRLGLGPDFDVDPKELERRYFAFQRTFHPDRFATKSVREQKYSLQHATNLNEAFERLKSPIKRAEVLLETKGLAARDEAMTESDPELLMEAMESREALEAAETDDELVKLETLARTDIELSEQALSVAFNAEDLAGVAILINRMKYLTKLLDEIRQKRRQVNL